VGRAEPGEDAIEQELTAGRLAASLAGRRPILDRAHDLTLLAGLGPILDRWHDPTLDRWLDHARKIVRALLNTDWIAYVYLATMEPSP
jgi:hypothetical protein